MSGENDTDGSVGDGVPRLTSSRGDGEALGIDAEELRRDAEELRRARLLLERAEEMAGIGSWEFDFATKQVVGSPGALKIYGAPSSGLRIEDMERVPLPEYRPLMDMARDDHIKRGLPYDIEFKIRRMNDGAILDVHSRAAWDPVHKRLFGIIRDITQEKKADEEIRRLNRELEARVAERTGQLSAANEALSKALVELEAQHEQKILAEKMATLGRLVATLSHELNTPIGAIKSESGSELRDAPELARRLSSLHRLDDSDFDTLLAILDNATPTRMATLDDAPGIRLLRKSYEKSLKAAACEDAGMVSDELIDLGFAGTADQLLALRRGPSFAGLVHLAGELTASIRADAVISAASEKAERVIRTLQTYVSGGLGQQLVRTDVRSVIERALAAQRRMAGPGVGIELLWAEATEIHCFPEQLEQVWTNLISNALHSMGRSGKLRIETLRDGDDVIVRVIDDGPGIPEQMQARVFTPFFTTKAPGLGAGLGLDSSKRILEAIGGSIGFKSGPGSTCFTVRLKAAT